MEEQQELPQGWEITKLDEVMLPVRGIAFPKEVKAHAPAEGHIACLRTTNVQRKVEWGDLWFIPRQYAKREDQIIQPLDILISTANSYELVGKVAQVHAIPHESTLGAFISLLRVKAPFDAKFFYHYLSASSTQEAIRGFASTTTNISNVSTGKLATLDVVVPPLPEQRRIVAKLEELFSKLDAGVAAVRRTQALLKRYRQSVLHAAVTGELTRAWREAHPAPAETGAALLKRIRAERRAQWEAAQVAKRGGQLTLGDGWKSKYVEPEAVDAMGLPELPEGWIWGSVEQLSNTVQYGSSAKTREDEGGVPVYRMGNIIDGKLDNSNFKYLPAAHEEFPALLLDAGDLLFNRTNSPELVGKTAVYRGTPAVASFASYLIRVKLNASISPDLVAYCLNSIYGKNWIKSVVTQQVGQANVNGTKLQAFVIPLPPVGEQAEIVAEVERRLTVLDALSRTLTDELKRAERLRQSILHRAFTGRLVPQDATDEPAAALLARLRETPAALAKTKAGRGRKAAGQIGLSF